MKTFILFWHPQKNWYDLSEISYHIEDGMCGTEAYLRAWTVGCNNQIEKGDRFFIICSQKSSPKNNSIYDYLQMMGDGIDKPDGVCFGGHFSSAPYLDDEEDCYVVNIRLEFAVQPGLFPVVNLASLKKAIPSFDWSISTGEYLIEGEQEKTLVSVISEWMKSSGLEDSTHTNVTERDLLLAYNNLFD